MNDLQNSLVEAAENLADMELRFPVHLNVKEEGILIRASNGTKRSTEMVYWENVASDISNVVERVVGAVR